MAIVYPARDDVPMNMGNHVSKAGQIYFVGLKQLANSLLNGKNNRHQRLLFRLS
jgi:hypothetical protein